MRIYPKDHVCGFRCSAATWGEFSNFYPLTAPVAAGPWRFFTSEAVYPAAKVAARPDVQQRIALAPSARAAAAIGRTPGLGIDPGGNAQRFDVMRWVLRMKRESNVDGIDSVLAATGPSVEVSTRDPYWGARPISDRNEGRNLLGRLWMELRQHLRDAQPINASKAPRATVNGGLRVVDSSSFELCRLKLACSNSELGRGTVRGNEGVHMLVDSPRDAPERGRKRSGSDPAESVVKGTGGALAENTERALRSDLAIFRSWCDEHGEAAVPASVDTLVGFVEATAYERTRRRLLTSLLKTG